MAYTILKEIGHGGMGCVYKCKSDSGQIIALKMMSNKVTCYPEYRRLFQSEVDTLKRMDHPLIVHIVGDAYQDNQGNLCLPMEYVEGQTLEQCINQNGVFPFDVTIKLMADILKAMQYVHDRRRIHRDIKPSNIMYRPDGRICIIDFGIAKDAKIGTGQTIGHIIGTDGYMSPEQANGLNIDCRTDIYSLGCVFYFLLTGKHAISKGQNDYETICNILKSIPELPSHTAPNIPSQIDEVFKKAVDKNMTQRYQTASEFQEAMEDAAGLTGPKITVGRLLSNDIVFDDIDISRKHLVIKFTEHIMTGGSKKTIQITDFSTHGTGINGKLLKHDSIDITFVDFQSLPEVLLSGKPNCRIDWNQVFQLFLEKRKAMQDTVSEEKNENDVITINETRKDVSSNHQYKENEGDNDELAWYHKLICFFFPIACLIYWVVYGKSYPIKAKKATKFSIIGFVCWTCINQLMTLL